MNQTEDNDVELQGTAIAQQLRVMRLVNISAISPSIKLRTKWKGPGGPIFIPASTVAKPIAKTLPYKVGKFLMDRCGGGGMKAWMGLREWTSPTDTPDTPETPEDIQTMKDIAFHEKVVAGTAKAPKFTPQQMRPWAGETRKASQSRNDAIPKPWWSVDMLKEWGKSNDVVLPVRPKHEDVVTECAQIAHRDMARGMDLVAPAAARNGATSAD